MGGGINHQPVTIRGSFSSSPRFLRGNHVEQQFFFPSPVGVGVRYFFGGMKNDPEKYGVQIDDVIMNQLFQSIIYTPTYPKQPIFFKWIFVDFPHFSHVIVGILQLQPQPICSTCFFFVGGGCY